LHIDYYFAIFTEKNETKISKGKRLIAEEDSFDYLDNFFETFFFSNKNNLSITRVLIHKSSLRCMFFHVPI